jgi:Xaa-Pro aminopeptidase
MNLESRLEKVRQKLAEKELDGFLVSQAENINYLSGFNSAEAFLLITPDKEVLATDFRYIEQAKRQAPLYEIFQIAGMAAGWFPRLVGDSGLKKLAFEAAQMTFSFHQKLLEALANARLDINLVPAEKIVEEMRMVKEPAEIELIIKAVAVSDGAMVHVNNKVRSGMTEREIAWEIEKFMRENGSQPLPFEAIVAAGPNAALPHAQPSEYVIHSGEPVVMDIGAKVAGYASDLTRTPCLGKDDGTYARIYSIVLQAQLTAIDLIREGMSGEEADGIARNIIKEAGYGDNFGHSLGHGIGLAIHEAPRLGPNSQDRLANGMVFSIEPGIYLPGWGGVRIEDTVVMENGRIRVLSRAEK